MAPFDESVQRSLDQLEGVIDVKRAAASLAEPRSKPGRGRSRPFGSMATSCQATSSFETDGSPALSTGAVRASATPPVRQWSHGHYPSRPARSSSSRWDLTRRPGRELGDG